MGRGGGKRRFQGQWRNELGSRLEGARWAGGGKEEKRETAACLRPLSTVGLVVYRYLAGVGRWYLGGSIDTS